MWKNSQVNAQVILLVRGDLVEGSEHLVEQPKCTLSPDDEAAEMTTRCELEEVESPDVDELDAGQVAERLDDAVVLVVDDEGATALTMSAVTHLSFAGTQLAGVGDLDDVGVGVQRLEESDSLLRFGERLGGVSDDKGNLLDLLDAMATGKDQRRQRRCSEGRNDGETALVLVHLDVPFAPGLGRGEHTSTTAHVSERGL